MTLLASWPGRRCADSPDFWRSAYDQADGAPLRHFFSEKKIQATQESTPLNCMLSKQYYQIALVKTNYIMNEAVTTGK
jgi:hypothetical protein